MIIDDALLVIAAIISVAWENGERRVYRTVPLRPGRSRVPFGALVGAGRPSGLRGRGVVPSSWG